MRGQFTGWPEQAMDVLWQLQGEPAPATRERCRADRERLVRQPMIALLNEVADSDPRYEDFSVWHYRTGSWWWQNQGAVIRLGRKVEIGLRFSLDGLRIQGAWWYPDPGQVDMFRPLGCEEWLHTPEALDRVLSAAADLDALLRWLARHVKRAA